MKAIIGFCALALSLGTVTQAATISTTLTVNATATLSSTAVTASGTATMPNVFTGSATFTGSLPLTSFTGTNAVGSFTITPSASNTLTGTFTLPVALFTLLLNGTASNRSGSVAITGGTGTYAGYTGTFPNVSGTGGTSAGVISIGLSGGGTINTSTTTTPTPTITAVQDAAGNTPSIAQGSIFIVKGTNLSASGFNEFSLPYPTSSSSIQIAFTASSGGASTNAYLVYLYNESGTNQLAAILPSTLAAGSYNVTVTNNNGSVTAPFAVTVVQHKPGLFTQDSSGAGLAVIQNYISASELDINRFTTGVVNQTSISPAKPGQTLIAWATGLGPVTTGDSTAPPFLNFLPGLNVQVIVGGVSITPTFAGRSGYPGEDQINFVLPANVPTGCTVSFQVSVNGTLSNPTFFAIAPSASANACVVPGLTTSQLQNLDNGGTVTGGAFDLEQFSANIITAAGNVAETFALVGGGFSQVTGFQLAASPVLAYQPGGCQVTVIAASQIGSGGQSGQTPVTTTGTATALDAGVITLTGPTASNINNAALTETSNVYNLTITEQITGLPSGVTLPGIPNASVVGGTYTLKGAGGKDVGPFTASINLGTPLTITGGLPATINRSTGLTLNWTGGNATDEVEIFGESGGASGFGTFVCIANAGAGTFTVPASILNQLPAVTAAGLSAGSTGLLGVFSTPSPVAFSAPLTAGGTINNALFLALLGIEGSAAFQ
jgi:uncharacterized protein (TIGR03437 family)